MALKLTEIVFEGFHLHISLYGILFLMLYLLSGPVKLPINKLKVCLDLT